MAGNSFGKQFCITTFGESHGPAIGVVIDGCPAGLAFDLEFVAAQLARRRPGQSNLTTDRNEADYPELLSGVFEGRTTGTPIAMLIRNADQRSGDYEAMRELYRPSHADYTYEARYGIRDHRGGGRSSARETAARVAAGALAQLFLQQMGISIKAWVSGVGPILLEQPAAELDLNRVDESLVRCPHPEISAQMEQLIAELKEAGDSVGGQISCQITGVPAGLGDPVFDKLEADLAKAMLSINAVKAFEVGSGFAASMGRGSVYNDAFEMREGRVATRTNHSGGIQGGISNGETVFFKLGFKPVATIAQKQDTITRQGETAELAAQGRHDPCVVPRAVPIVEAMAALVLADHVLRMRLARL
ncbi:MAG: chorismate synthase [Bacteroidia bacterium]